MSAFSSARVAVPRPPEHPPPFRFPVIVAVAPVIVAVVIWLVTGSAFALVFAALGPVTAVATWLESWFGARRTRRREGIRFAAEVVEALAEIDRRHDRERSRLREVTPEAGTLLQRRGADPYRWTGTATSTVLVTIGRGSVQSGVELETSLSTSDADVDAQLKRLIARAVTLEGAPVSVDARLSIGVCGTTTLAMAVARAVALQVAWTLSPATHWWAGESRDEQWLTEIPHERRHGSARSVYAEFGVRGETAASVTVALAASRADLPGGCRVVVLLGERGAEIVHHPDPAERKLIQPVTISREQALVWARRAAHDAAREGLASSEARLPHTAALADILGDPAPVGRESLACALAVGASGVVMVDLVEHGPHAVVGGTTGSGKSELLVAWVLAMAAARSPADVTFLLVDFKGGSAFAALAELTHTVGIITDLDTAGAARALDSLRAEVRYRERLLVAEGARSIEEIESLPRLVIVVDEFAAMLTDHPDLHALFADLAARGRSLGVHLVLCTQRPSGVVRDGVLANADLRVSLRVNNRADSSAVVGTEDAADIASRDRGRGILRRGGEMPQSVQFALAGPPDIALVRQRWSLSPAPRRPWCEPLPEHVPMESLSRDTSGVPFALADFPQEQRQGTADFSPPRDGHLLVLGASASGKSTALEVIAAGHDSAVHVSAECDAAWDTIGDLTDALDSGEGHSRLVILDDLDSLIPRFGGEHRAAFLEALSRVLRDGPRRGIHVALSAQRLSGEMQALAALVPCRLMLRHSSRQDFVIAGGEGAQFREAMPHGRGLWRGTLVQVAHVPVPVRVASPARETHLTPGRPLAVVTTRVAHLLARLPRALALADADDPRAVVASGSTLIGDIDEWQSRWGLIAALRPTAEILFDGCSPADFRAVTRSRLLPPPISSGLCWRLNEDGSASRSRLPA